MCSRSKASWLVLLVMTLLGSACSKSRRCGGEELCNGRDDDCNGEIDETFVDDRGRYVGVAHCGGCGIDCNDEMPTAAATSCQLKNGQPQCQLDRCPSGTHALDGNRCVPDQTALCLPCETDRECVTQVAGARCLERENERRCGIPCSARQPCPAPFSCDTAIGQCLPDTAICACQDVSETVEVACLAQGSATNLYCAGLATCGPGGLSQCKIAAQESCDGKDNDCDGQIDEDFVDAMGRYVGRLHCGACGKPCSPPGEHYQATCAAQGAGAAVTCTIACEKGFVDVDGIEGNGCECQRFDGSSAPASSGGDNDCDGKPDDDTTFVHVTSSGSDNGTGTRLAPMRSIQAAVQRAQRENKVVLVAQGSYDRFAIVAGVGVFGGYRTDFRARDPNLYPVVIEHAEPRNGAPVLTCSGVQSATLIDGLTLVGQDATSAGVGSTAVRFDDCSNAVRLKQVVVIAGRGADGQNGEEASKRLPSWAPSLGALDGRDGSPGALSAQQAACLPRAGGAAASKLCGATDVSGGAGGAATCLDSGCSDGSRCANAGCTDFTVNGVCDLATVLALAVANPRAGAGSGSAPGAAGIPTYNAPSARGTCNFCDDNPTLPRQGDDGAAGQPGAIGLGGAGCTDTALMLDGEGRATAAAGAEGAAGAAGSGGGGGSAGSGFDAVRGIQSSSCVDVAGGSGGSGGSGGCGAPGGGAGSGAGASLGIVVRPAVDGSGPSFEQVRIVTSSGGRGGDGGLGAAGGRAGLGAPGGGSSFWCSRSGGRGGDGGSGGAGGGGGGGCGGSSHALLFGAPPSAAYRAEVSSSLLVELAGVAGQGGRGGFSPGASGALGAAGSDERVR